MGIKGVTDVSYPAGLTRIRLGIEKDIEGRTTKSGEQMTRPENTWEFISDDPDIERVYGKNPKELHIMFDGTDADVSLAGWKQWFDGSGFLVCQGDGTEAAYRATHHTQGITDLQTGPGFMRGSIKRTCKGDTCPNFLARQCSNTFYIRFKIPRVSMFRNYEFVTHSYNTYRDFYTAFVQHVGSRNLNGLGLVFKIFKIEESKPAVVDNKKQARKFKYVTIQLDRDFWNREGEGIVKEVAGVVGFNVIQQLGPGAVNFQRAIDTRAVALEEQIKAHQADVEKITEPQNLQTHPALPPEGSKVPSEPKDVSHTALESDPEIIAAVESMYKSIGKPVPKTAVSSAIKKYQTKEAIIAAAQKKMQQPPTPPPGAAAKAPPSGQQSTPPGGSLL